MNRSFYCVSFTVCLLLNLLLKMIFSVEISNFLYSVGILPDLVQNHARETVSEVFLPPMDIPIQVWPMVEAMSRDFNELHIAQVPMTENQPGETQKMEEVAEHGGINYPDTPYSRYVAQPVDDFFFPWEDEGYVDNPIQT